MRTQVFEDSFLLSLLFLLFLLNLLYNLQPIFVPPHLANELRYFFDSLNPYDLSLSIYACRLWCKSRHKRGKIKSVAPFDKNPQIVVKKEFRNYKKDVYTLTRKQIKLKCRS